jgi:hypothetical protein
MRVAYLRRPGEEVPVLSNLRASTAVKAALGMCRASQCAVHDAPLSINNDSVPPVIGARDALHVQNLTRALEISSDDLGMQTDGIAHIAYEHSDLLTAATLRLDDSSGIRLAFVVFFP